MIVFISPQVYDLILVELSNIAQLTIQKQDDSILLGKIQEHLQVTLNYLFLFVLLM